MDLLTLLPSGLLALLAIGMSLAFWSADRGSPTTRALALALVAMGVSVGLGMPLHELNAMPAWARWLALADALAIYAFLEWILRVRHQTSAGDLDPRFADRLLRAGQAGSLVFAAAGLLAPGLRVNVFLNAFGSGGLEAAHRLGFWLFAGPLFLAILAAVVGSLLFLRRRPDRPEYIRALGCIAATPFLGFAMVMPEDIAILSMTLGLLLILAATMHYLVIQGQRGEFMARFLSRRVAELVRRRGLQQAMRESSLELSVVCVDLRGFTAYSQVQSSAQVIGVLREYYRVACEVVARYDGTIKDLAGDGILVLVGAPLPVADHAARALEMADGIRAAVSAAAQRWSAGAPRLGVGLGIASGPVTVGAIDAGDRYEYTAVGSAVNLASRLCEEAADGEILAAERTLELAGTAAPARLEPRPPVQVKGFAEPVPHRNLRHALPA
ncbi:adenylate/guanylate cyclase domain-containing protein [Solimonas fluminis]|uniref:Adenylate/guanylate cyclase domain-containing protein n=1 Tax=Solimonas fluminis TaxID=2086571 RepID=A0A2S5TM22_9GAMM|nr:adenylate/guanylate cyclase domain-containing protein [Solimonas fluminis]PPE75987.1 adenylate/guanylate cyclase domain-containing protein [Solimonas fluminis]